MLNGLFVTLRLSGGGSGGSFPRPLKAEEERMYLEKFAEGDMEARNILIEHNLRLVAHIIKKYYTQSGDQDDLISIGTIGLIKGISTFKADKNVRLATYASRCIENAILPPRPRMERGPVRGGRRAYRTVTGQGRRALRLGLGKERPGRRRGRPVSFALIYAKQELTSAGNYRTNG